MSAALGLLLDLKLFQRSYDVWKHFRSLDGLPIIYLEHEMQNISYYDVMGGVLSRYHQYYGLSESMWWYG